MEIVNLFLPATNRFATDYYAQTPEMQEYFHYNYKRPEEYEERVKELTGRSFMRNELADHIQSFMQHYPGSNEVDESLAKLRKNNSVVVIGGQQAGILTGPLYSIHKVISIIAFAKEKEKELGVPVVPIFWIAGEDHDYMEVNHVYLEDDQGLQKCVYPEKIHDKRMVSDCLLDRNTCLSWVREIIESFGETEYTNELLAFSENAIKHSQSFVDFFAFITMELFKKHGLLLVDSGNKQLRSMEKDFFIQQIHDAEGITAAVKNQQTILQNAGFNQAIEITANAANLFYYDEENYERVLLEYDVTANTFVGKNGLVSFTKDELLRMASESPEKLSNNVVTRPVMQELLFPTLAFIAGPGEISYWAELKKVFEGFGMKMPPIVPRLNITLLERDVESELTELQLDLLKVLQSGVTDERTSYLDSIKDKSFELLFHETKEMLTEQYLRIEEKTEQEYRGLVPLLKKNKDILLKQIQFMEGKLEEAVLQKHGVMLEKYRRIETSLRPSDGPQERTWNIYYFLNKYGLNFVDDLTKLPFEFDGNHKVVKL
ncbi:bacillithiol biosynthesis cysteine-adding enzyme BshC [Bacillus dakarensis]|uniref:bacillithiol biosynthesis cysteine-adding enzyme BshC n=1 Tax=Robertmurraya dakarensis TaxID=1926278 RepID=UPI00098107CF|nr:bacillithiol biosynthesis cysteine-adding enzyme BshC [Bacillus dakarensis]